MSSGDVLSSQKLKSAAGDAPLLLPVTSAAVAQGQLVQHPLRDGAPVHVDMEALAAEVAEAARAADAARDPGWMELLERLRPWALRHPPAY